LAVSRWYRIPLTDLVNRRINSLVNKTAIAMPRSIIAKTLALPLLDRFRLGTLFANLKSHLIGRLPDRENKESVLPAIGLEWIWCPIRRKEDEGT